jgi:hypothetical protein
VLWLRGNHTANYRGCIKWKEARAALAKQAPKHARKNAATSHPADPKLSGTGPLPSRWNWERGGITSYEGGVLLWLPLPSLHNNPKILSPAGKRRSPSRLKWPLPGTWPGLKSHSPNLQ